MLLEQYGHQVSTDHVILWCYYAYSAHTNQFVRPGYYYLKHDYGVGKLGHGGSYVTFVNKDNPSDFTIVIETMV